MRAQTAPTSQSTTAPTSQPTTKSAVPDDLIWHDVRDWGLEGRAFGDVEHYFDRLPARAKEIVREPVWNLSRHTAGFSTRFQTDARSIYLRYEVLNEPLAMAHMPATGVSGVDLYGMTGSPKNGGWNWLATHQPRAKGTEARLVDGILPGTNAPR